MFCQWWRQVGGRCYIPVGEDFPPPPPRRGNFPIPSANRDGEIKDVVAPTIYLILLESLGKSFNEISKISIFLLKTRNFHIFSLIKMPKFSTYPQKRPRFYFRHPRDPNFTSDMFSATRCLCRGFGLVHPPPPVGKSWRHPCIVWIPCNILCMCRSHKHADAPFFEALAV